MVVHVLTGENGGATGRAERGCDEGIFQVGTIPGHAIQIGCFEEVGGIRVAREKVVTMVVGQNDDEVGFFRTQRCAYENWKKAKHGYGIIDGRGRNAIRNEFGRDLKRYWRFSPRALKPNP